VFIPVVFPLPIMVAIILKVRRATFPRNKVALLDSIVILIVSVSLIALSLHMLHQSQNNNAKSNSSRVLVPIIHTSMCDEDPTSNMSTTMLSSLSSLSGRAEHDEEHRPPRRQRGDYPRYHHISDIVEGPGIDVIATAHTTTDEAVCKFRTIQYWGHYPHV
jgi:hypothetical protein